MADNNVTFMFLNQTFSDLDGNVKYFQILENKEWTDTIISKVVDVNALKEIYNRSKIDKNLKIDFSIENGFLKAEDVPNSKLNEVVLSQIKDTQETFASSLKSVYDLFLILAKNDGYYIDDVDKLDEPLVKFIPTYSTNTMTVYLSRFLNDTDGWRNVKLVYVEDGVLTLGKFNFAIPKSKANLVEGFGAKLVKEANLRLTGIDEVFCIYQSTPEMNIYSYTESDMKIFPSIVNRYCYISELSDSLEKTCSLFANTIASILNNSEQEPSMEKVDKSKYVSKYTNYYVTIKLQYKKLTKQRRLQLLEDFVNNVEPRLNNGEWEYTDVLNYVKSKNYTFFEKITYMQLVNLMTGSGRLSMDRLEQAQSLIKMYKLRKLEADTILYKLRSLLFVKRLNIGMYNTRLLKGSDVSFETVIKRQTKEGV